MKSKAGAGVNIKNCQKQAQRIFFLADSPRIPEKNWKSNLSLIGVQTVIGFCFCLHLLNEVSGSNNIYLHVN